MTNYGRSTYVSWNTGSVLELLDFSGISASTESLETTAYGSAYRTFVPGMTDYGSVSLTLATDNIPDIMRLRRSYTDRSLSDLNIITPIGFQYAFQGFITDFSHVLDKNGIYTIQVTVKLSGKPRVAPYEDFSIVPTTGSTLIRGGSYGLFLTTTGGEGALWLITTEHVASTKLIGNTLLIDAEEEAKSLTVTAQWYDEDGEKRTAKQATYTIAKPIATSISINEFDRNITFKKTDVGPTNKDFKWTVYPIGAEKKADPEFYDERGTKITDGTFTISSAVGGLLVLDHDKYKAKYADPDVFHKFSVKITLQNAVYLFDKQDFTVMMKSA